MKDSELVSSEPMGTDHLPEKSAAAGWLTGLTGQGVVGCFGSRGESAARCHSSVLATQDWSGPAPNLSSCV